MTQELWLQLRIQELLSTRRAFLINPFVLALIRPMSYLYTTRLIPFINDVLQSNFDIVVFRSLVSLSSDSRPTPNDAFYLTLSLTRGTRPCKWTEPVPSRLIPKTTVQNTMEIRFI